MSKCDQYFAQMCTDILERGTTTQGQKVRPHWADGTPAYTIKKFGQINRYDLREEFPIMTLRRVAVKSAFDEILWIWQKKSNNIHDLGSHIWDSWADETGSIGKAYGYQMAVKHPCRDVSDEGLENAFPGYTFVLRDGGCSFEDPQTGRCAAVKKAEDAPWLVDQVDKVIYDLKNNPFSRRIITTLWNPQDLSQMNLEPCAYNMTFNVTEDAATGKLVLNGILDQRSQDILSAFAWNEYQYGACLMAAMAQVCDMEAGTFIHVIADAHIYDRHVDAVRELLSRTPRPAPKLWINPEIHDFYKFTPDDIKLIDYEVAGPQIKGIPVAI